jgi:hypothetical protein
MTPKRIQRRRTKGWRLPPNTVVVDRTSRFGNPFTAKDCRAAGFQGTDEEIKARCVEAFRVWLGPFWYENWQGEESKRRRQAILNGLPRLRGKDLACFCKEGEVCHGDVLIELANKPA